MKKILFVVAPKDFRDEEYFLPKRILESRGFEVETASLQKGEIKGVAGKTAQADLLVSEARPRDYAAVIFVGGPGIVDLVGEPQLTDLAKRFHGQGKLVAAICAAPAILANAGLLKGVSATCWSGMNSVLARKGAVLANKPVVWSGNIVTANGPLVAQDFAEKIAEILTDGT